MIGRLFFRAFLRVLGWKLEGPPPPLPRYVLIAAPHTSNWDGFLLVAFASVCRIKISWMAKQSLFRPPFGWLVRLAGGIPIDRSARHDMVANMVRLFSEKDRLILVVPPEGTRKRAEYWKSGFYHVSRGAGVPIVLSFLDYSRKRGGFGTVFTPTGNIKNDMDLIRAFYAGKAGKFPELVTPPRLKDEDDAGRVVGSS